MLKLLPRHFLTSLCQARIAIQTSYLQNLGTLRLVVRMPCFVHIFETTSICLAKVAIHVLFDDDTLVVDMILAEFIRITFINQSVVVVYALFYWTDIHGQFLHIVVSFRFQRRFQQYFVTNLLNLLLTFTLVSVFDLNFNRSCIQFIMLNTVDCIVIGIKPLRLFKVIHGSEVLIFVEILCDVFGAPRHVEVLLHFLVFNQ